MLLLSRLTFLNTGFGYIQVFRIVAPNCDVEHWATNDPMMEAGERREWSRQGVRHRELLPPVEAVLRRRAGAGRNVRVQKCHIVLSLRAFVRLEAHRLEMGISGYASKANLIREASCLYLQNPTIVLKPITQLLTLSFFRPSYALTFGMLFD